MTSQSRAPAMITADFSRPAFDLSGGRPEMDLVNTVHGRGSRFDDQLRGYEDLLAWAVQGGLIETARAQHLVAEAGRRPEQAAAVLKRAKQLREAIFRIFAAVVAGEVALADDLELLNGELANALARARLVADAGYFRWAWATAADDFDGMLWMVVRSAAEALTAPQVLERVRVCGLQSCSWLFVDATRNRSRQWCDMKTCGNRAKARRHYQRQKRLA